MPEKKQLSEKEKKLIEGCNNGDKEAENEFDDLFRPIIFPITMKFVKNIEEAEDHTQEILWRCFVKMKEGKATQNLRAWVLYVTINYCIGKFREKKSMEAIKFIQTKTKDDKRTALIDQYQDSKAIAPGSKEYYSKDDEHIHIDTLYKRNIPQKTRKGLEFSIKLIEIFYKLKNKMKLNPAKYILIYKIRKETDNYKEKVNRNLGPISKKKIESYYRLRVTLPDYLSDREKRELEKLKKQEISIAIHNTLNEFVGSINSMIYDMALYDFLSIFKKTPYDGKYFLFYLFDLALKCRNMKIKPPRLMFSVWANCLKKGKNTDLKKIKFIFSYFKRKTKGTGQEFLFNSIDEDISTFESIRKSYYKKSINLEPFNELVDFIYKYSFRPDQLDLGNGEWIK